MVVEVCEVSERCRATEDVFRKVIFSMNDINIWENFDADMFQPPGGPQDVGEFGPYYIMVGDKLYAIPDENICRDYNFGFTMSDHEMRDLATLGWCNSMESGALLESRSLKSKAVIVLTDNAWKRGEKPKFYWCVRAMFKPSNPSSSLHTTDDSMDNYDDFENEDMIHKQKYGFRVLWPISPTSALNAFKKWTETGQKDGSRLLTIWEPSASQFDIKHILEAYQVSQAGTSTIRLIQSVIPSKKELGTRLDSPIREMKIFQPASEANSRVSCGRFTSNVVASGLQRRAHACFAQITQFTASNHTGWNSLCEDTRYYIWDMLAEECISTEGNKHSPSFQMWLTLRLVCKESKDAVETQTSKLMENAFYLMQQSLKSKSVADAICVRNLLVPKGLVPQSLLNEIAFARHGKKKRKHEASLDMSILWKTIWPFVRLRTNIPIARKTPKRPPPKPPVIANAAPQPIRASFRLKLKRDVNADDDEADGSQKYKRITIYMRTEDPKPAPIMRAPVTPTFPDTSPLLDTWIQCTQCAEWRMLPPSNSKLVRDGLFDSLSILDMPEDWTCAMHPLGLYRCEHEACASSDQPALRRSARKRGRL